MLKAIESGWVQGQIADSAYRYQMELERGERVVVGVNAFAEGGERVPLSKVSPKLAVERARTLSAFRKGRDAARVETSLRRLEEVARSDGNTVPGILDAVAAKATLGEISDALRGVFGTYRQRQDI
jgi:methylmalonyl-CoA mutase N-terminal domain/subunit